MIKNINLDIVRLNPEFFPGAKEGDSLVSFPGGFQILVPSVVMDAIEAAENRMGNPAGNPKKPEPKATPKAPAVKQKQAQILEDAVNAAVHPEQEEDLKTKICIECGVSTKNVMPSGRCFSCATVRCPTCKAETTRAEMIGQYCPSCLKRGSVEDAEE